MNIDYHKQQTSPQMNQKNKSELGFFSKDKEADIAYQLSKNPITLPKSSQSNSEKKPEKTQNTYHEPTFQGRVPLIEGFTQSESVPALNQRFQTRDRAKYDQTKEKLINQGSTDEYLFFQLAKTALDLYGQAIKTRIITLKKDSGYSGVENDATFNRDEKLFQDWQNMLLPDISYRGPQQLQNIKKGSDMTKMLEKYNKFMKFKEDHKSSLEKINKYYEKIHSDNIPKYIDSISTLSQNLNSKQQEFDKQHQAIRDARRSLLKVLSPTAYGVATGVAGLYNAGVDYIGASAGYLWSFFESGIGYLIYDSDFNFESDIKSRFARVQKTQQMLKVSESSRQKSEFFGPDGLNITADNLIYQVSGGIMNMMSLLSGGQLIGQGLAKMGGAIGLKISQQIFMRGGLFTASFLLQVGPQFDEALNMGLDASKSFQYALLQSVVQSALELVSPNDLIMGRVGSAGIRDFIKNIGKEIFGENIQELSQLLAEKGLNYGANQVRDTQLDGVVSQGDIVNTVILTTLVTGIMAGSTGHSGKNQPGTKQKTSSKNITSKNTLSNQFISPFTPETNKIYTSTALNAQKVQENSAFMDETFDLDSDLSVDQKAQLLKSRLISEYDRLVASGVNPGFDRSVLEFFGTLNIISLINTHFTKEGELGNLTYSQLAAKTKELAYGIENENIRRFLLEGGFAGSYENLSLADEADVLTKKNIYIYNAFATNIINNKEELTKIYRSLALKMHPDPNGGKKVFEQAFPYLYDLNSKLEKILEQKDSNIIKAELKDYLDRKHEELTKEISALNIISSANAKAQEARKIEAEKAEQARQVQIEQARKEGEEKTKKEADGKVQREKREAQEAKHLSERVIADKFSVNYIGKGWTEDNGWSEGRLTKKDNRYYRPNLDNEKHVEANSKLMDKYLGKLDTHTTTYNKERTEIRKRLLEEYDYFTEKGVKLPFEKSEIENLTKYHIVRMGKVHKMKGQLGSITAGQLYWKLRSLYSKKFSFTDGAPIAPSHLVRFLFEGGFLGQQKHFPNMESLINYGMGVKGVFEDFYGNKLSAISINTSAILKTNQKKADQLEIIEQASAMIEDLVYFQTALQELSNNPRAGAKMEELENKMPDLQRFYNAMMTNIETIISELKTSDLNASSLQSLQSNLDSMMENYHQMLGILLEMEHAPVQPAEYSLNEKPVHDNPVNDKVERDRQSAYDFFRDKFESAEIDKDLLLTFVDIYGNHTSVLGNQLSLVLEDINDPEYFADSMGFLQKMRDKRVSQGILLYPGELFDSVKNKIPENNRHQLEKLQEYFPSDPSKSVFWTEMVSSLHKIEHLLDFYAKNGKLPDDIDLKQLGEGIKKTYQNVVKDEAFRHRVK